MFSVPVPPGVYCTWQSHNYWGIGNCWMIQNWIICSLIYPVLVISGPIMALVSITHLTWFLVKHASIIPFLSCSTKATYHLPPCLSQIVSECLLLELPKSRPVQLPGLVTMTCYPHLSSSLMNNVIRSSTCCQCIESLVYWHNFAELIQCKVAIFFFFFLRIINDSLKKTRCDSMGGKGGWGVQLEPGASVNQSKQGRIA